jgi:hypothetical protein
VLFLPDSDARPTPRRERGRVAGEGGGGEGRRSGCVAGLQGWEGEDDGWLAREGEEQRQSGKEEMWSGGVWKRWGIDKEMEVER